MTVEIKTFQEMSARNYSMFEKTYDSYKREAIFFLKQVAVNKNLAIHGGLEGLRELVHEALATLVDVESKKRTTGSWHKLKRALSVFYAALGQDDLAALIKAARNPVPWQERPSKTGKNRRQITVAPEDLEKMLDYLFCRMDYDCYALCIVASQLGLRPVEMCYVRYEVVEGGTMLMVRIRGAKKTKRGEFSPSCQRGIEREMYMPYSEELNLALQRCQNVSLKELKKYQERIRRASLAIWPQRKRRFCLYSLRYAMGSNLKAHYAGDPDGRRKIAAVMGHKNTSSTLVYGNIRSGSGGVSLPVATNETLAQVVDDCDSFRSVRKKIGRTRSVNTVNNGAPKLD